MQGATRIQGNSRATWYRAGRYFDADGKEMSAEEAAKPAYTPDAPEPEPDPETRGDKFPYAPAPVPKKVAATKSDLRVEPKIWPPESNPVKIEVPAATPDLDKMNAAQLAKLVRVAGGEPAKGAGARAANLAWLKERYA